jgi:hypothetical protein
MMLFYQGILPDGTNVGDYAAAHDYGIGVIPDANMNNMQAIFYNTATNLDGFNEAMQAQRDKYEGKNAFMQWWYSSLMNDINTIN